MLNNMEYRIKKPPIFDESVSFNCNIIAEILGMFLKSNPQVSAVQIPDFRIKQLTRCSRTLNGKTGIIEGDVLEAIGSFYSLCMYYGVTTEFGSKDIFLQSLSLLETILGECIIALQLVGEVYLTHPDDKMLNFSMTVDKIKQSQLTTFTACNELLKDIIRDTVRQVRICREKGNSRTKSKQPTDCLLAHSIFVMCSYGLAHMAAVLHHQGRMKEAPGLYEALLCVIHFECKRDMYKVRATEKLRKAKRLADVDRYEECTSLAKNVCYVVLKKIDITYIRQLRSLRARLSRGQTTPFIDFAKLKSKMIGSDLLQQAPLSVIDDAQNPLNELTEATVEKLLLPPSDNGDSVLNVVPHVKIQERCIPATDFALRAGASWPEALVTALNDKLEDESAPLTMAQRELALIKSETKNPTYDDNSIDDHSANTEAEREFKEMIEISKLPSALRYYYVFSRPLRYFAESHKRVYFNPTDKARQLQHKGKTKAKVMGNEFVTTEAIQQAMECTYYDSASRPLPRFLNQSEGMYWACNVLVEHIFQQVTAGNMFPETNQRYLTNLQERARRETRELKKCRQTGLKTIAVTIKIDPVDAPSFATIPIESDKYSPKSSARSALSERSRNSKRNAGNSTQAFATGSNRKSNVDTVTKKLSIIERLSLAHQEAIMERRLDSSLARSNPDNERAARIKYLETSLPMLNESTGDDLSSDTSRSSVTIQRMMSQSSYERKDQTSVVWTPVPELEDEMELRKKKEKAEVEKKKHYKASADFDSIPTKFGLDYARSIQKFQEERKREKEQFEQEMIDQQEIEILKIKAANQRDKKGEKESEKRVIIDSLNYKKVLEDQKREIKAQLKAKKKLEEKQKAEREEQEEERIRELKSWDKMKTDREKRMKEERYQMEKVRLRNMANKKEYEDILRSHKEEMRMKYLEEIQRAKEERKNEEQRKLHTLLMQKRKKAKEDKQRVLSKIRKGNFMYHHGKLGFYADILDEERPYIQYEEDDGTPYYFDPVTLKTQYELPAGASVIHYTVKERQEHDRLYGEGAYDAMMAERQFKEQCNIDGGYWGDDGQWVILSGYYDENYEFVSMF